MLSNRAISNLAVYIAPSLPRLLPNSENTNIVTIQMFEGNRDGNIENSLEQGDCSQYNSLRERSGSLACVVSFRDLSVRGASAGIRAFVSAFQFGKQLPYF